MWYSLKFFLSRTTIPEVLLSMPLHIDMKFAVSETPVPLHPVVYPEIFFGGVQQIQLRTEGRENGNLGVVAP
jgi:hypothetical protein